MQKGGNADYIFTRRKISDLSKFKAFAADSTNKAEMVEFVFDMIENIVGKGENVGYKHVLFFKQCFGKSSFLTLYLTIMTFTNAGKEAI